MKLSQYLIFALLFNCAFALAQDFQGKAYYFSKTTPDMSGWTNGNQMSEAQKKQIMDRMRGMFEKTYILDFDRQVSLFKEEEVLEAPGGKSGFVVWGSSFSAGPQYKDIKSKSFLQSQDFFGKLFLISEPLEPLDWQLGSETKMIGQYLCMKATAWKTVDELDWKSMRRKTKTKKTEKDSTNTSSATDDFEVPKQIEVTAWYTMQIPVSHGPAEYWGLPGLILEVNADKTTMLCSKIIMNPENKTSIEAPKKGKTISRADYNTTVKQKMEEMRQMYRGRGKGRY
jgi:GLPGLI family protein